MVIGEQLRQARMTANMSQEQLAEIMSVSRQTISNWENSRSYPDIERVMRLAELYHLSLDELLRGDQQMVRAWVSATNAVRTGKILALLLLLNLIWTIGIVLFSQIVWLTVVLLLLLVGCIAGAFYLVIKLI